MINPPFVKGEWDFNQISNLKSQISNNMPETVKQWLDALSSNQISARESVELALKRIDSCESKIDAFISLRPDDALKVADKIDKKKAAGEKTGPLAGLPIAVKDLICEKGIECKCASRILEGYFPTYDATAAQNLKSVGAICLGRLNMDEFAMGSSTENSGYKLTKNPWDTERIPGGSSGGSAAAVAARQAPFAIGSDTGGSIRQPASLCGVTGLKPTYGRVSRYGLVAYASSLDQIGTLTLNVEDAARVLPFIAGHDINDSTSANIPAPDYLSELSGDLKGKKIGVPKEYFVEGIDKEVEAAVRTAIDKFSELGAEIEEVSLPHTEYAIAAYYVVATAEASSNLARYDGIHYGKRASGIKNLLDVYTKTRGEFFGEEVKRRIMLGTYVLSSGYYDAYYLKGLKVRTLIKQDFEKTFDKVDAIITPTCPTPAFKIGEKTEDPLQMYLSDIFTVSVNLAGLPAISIPCGFSNDCLPIGVQLIAKPFDESALFNFGFAYQEATDFHKKRPPVCGI